MKAERFEFPGHADAMLAGRLDRPVGPVRATALFAHCFTCTKDIAAARRIAARLAGLGVAVLRFDFTGLGHSEGEFANTSFSSNVDDLVAASDALRDRLGAPQILIGHSLGGAAVIAAAARLPDVRAVATIGAPHDPAHVLHNFGHAVDRITTEGTADVTLAGRQFTIGRGFVEDVSAVELDSALRSLGKALLVLHAPRDDTVGIENAGAIFSAAKHPKSFVSLDGADHLLSRAADADYAATVIAAWVERYVEFAHVPVAPTVPEGITRSSEADAKGFLQDIVVAGQHTTADEPVAYGGTDQGFTPYQFISAGLAACTSMTIRMYARRKNWPLAHVSVDVTHDKIHAMDCETCESTEGKVDRFRREIRLVGDLSTDQRNRLLEIADRCPVHRTLHGEVGIDTALA